VEGVLHGGGVRWGGPAGARVCDEEREGLSRSDGGGAGGDRPFAGAGGDGDPAQRRTAEAGLAGDGAPTRGARTEERGRERLHLLRQHPFGGGGLPRRDDRREGGGPVRATAGLLLLGLLAVAPAARGSAAILVTVADGPDAGLNDPTHAEPVGGNTATTVGGQRLAVFQRAAEIWGQALDSAVPIHVLASFRALSCSANSGILGQAYSPNIYSSDSPNFTSGKPPTVFHKSSTWYEAAESERFAGVSVLSGTGSSLANYEIVATFNVALDTPGCLGGIGWYYGFDTNHGQKNDLLTVVLHEFGHGLGFTSQDDATTGAHESGEPDIWDSFLYDDSIGLHWIDMSDSQRLAPGTGGALTSGGPAVNAPVPNMLEAALVLRAFSTPPKDYTTLEPADFGGSVASTPVSGPIGVAANQYACNSSVGSLGNLAGTIAIVDRGPPDAGCPFWEQARSVQDARAVAIRGANY